MQQHFLLGNVACRSNQPALNNNNNFCPNTSRHSLFEEQRQEVYKTTLTPLIDSNFKLHQKSFVQPQPPKKSRQAVFSVEYFDDGTVEVLLDGSLSISNRYAHLTKLLHDFPDDPAWRVIRFTAFPHRDHNGTDGLFPTQEEDCQHAEFIGNLTVALPELFYEQTTVKFRLIPVDTENTHINFANDRVRVYDYCSLEQAIFEAHRIRLTHRSDTICQISVNHLQCAQTTTKELPKCVDSTYVAWKHAADPSMIQCEPVITICVQNKDCTVPLFKFTNPGEKMTTESFKKNDDAARLKGTSITYKAPRGCERQSDAQAIYRERFSTMLSPQPQVSCAKSIYDEGANEYSGFLRRQFPQKEFKMSAPIYNPEKSLGEFVSDMSDVSSLRSQLEEQAKQIAMLRQRFERDHLTKKEEKYTEQYTEQ